MAQNMLGSVEVANDWVNLVVSIPAAAGVTALVMNRGVADIEIYPSNSNVDPAANASGIARRGREQGMWTQAANIWVRSWGGKCIVAVMGDS